MLILVIIVGFCVNAEAFYDKPYLEYDEYGLKQVNCMRCNVPVKTRTIRLVRHKEGEEPVYVEAIRAQSNLVRIPVELNNGSWTNLLMCLDCKKNYAFWEEKEGMARQLKAGWVDEAIGLKRSIEEVDGILDRVKNTTVLRKHDGKENLVPSFDKPIKNYKVKRRSKVKGGKK